MPDNLFRKFCYRFIRNPGVQKHCKQIRIAQPLRPISQKPLPYIRFFPYILPYNHTWYIAHEQPFWHEKREKYESFHLNSTCESLFQLKFQGIFLKNKFPVVVTAYFIRYRKFIFVA